jgi:RNA polymerase sigma-70 factor (ECF subfamily)
MPPEETAEGMSLGERELVARAKEDPSAFGALYDAYVDKIYNYVYHRVGNHHDSEDLTSRTFYRALNNIHRYTDRGLPFSAWLYRIAHNLVANWHRDRSRREVLSLDGLVIVGPQDQAPELMLERAEDFEALQEAIRKLPSERQQLLILKHSEGLSNADIGRIMGRSEGAVKSLYYRTLLALKRHLGGAKEPDGEEGSA